MVHEGMTITTANGETFVVGKRLSQGNLGEVYWVTAPTGQPAPWVLKVMRDSSGAYDYFLTDELNAITTMRQKMPSAQARMLPEVQEARLDNDQPGLLLEFIDQKTKLLRYANTIRQSASELDWEGEMWRIAELYATFLYHMQRDARIIGNDRKLDDFYLFPNPTSRAQDRLVVLDWNVVQQMDDPASDPLNDVMLFGRAWFNLFGGTNEASYDMNTPELAGYSVAGRGVLWHMVNANLRRATYGKQREDVTRLLLDTISHVRRLLMMDEMQLQAELKTQAQLVNLQKIADSAKTMAEADLALLPLWQVADLLFRKTKQSNSTLQDILSLRDAIANKMQASVVNSLESISRANEFLQSLRTEESQKGRAYVESWQATLHDLLEVARDDNADLKPLRDVSGEFHHQLNRYLTSPSTPPAALLIELGKVRKRVVYLMEQHQNKPKTRTALTGFLARVDVLTSYLDGQKALLNGDPFTARDLFLHTQRQVETDVPASHREWVMALLPSDLSAVIERLNATLGDLQTPPASLHDMLSASMQGDVARADALRQGLLNSDYLSPTQRIALERQTVALGWMGKINQLRHIALQEALDELAKLLIAYPYPAVQTWAASIITQAVAQFEQLAAQNASPTEDRALLAIGQRLLAVHHLMSNTAPSAR